MSGGGKTKIEWADRVWNPVTGCTKISEGCRNCYAERMSKRLAGRAGYPRSGFKVTMHPERLEEPLRWKKPSKIFVCSMGDLFHEAVSDEFLDEVFAVMAASAHHTFMVLTKRPARMKEYILKAMYDENCNYEGWYVAIARRGIPDAAPLENACLGVSVENQKTADERIPLLFKTPAAKRFVSYEPALEPIDIESYLLPQCRATREEHESEHGGGEWCNETRIDWVIMGGESGPHARPMRPNWARSMRDQCQDAGVPFFFKQWGEWLHSSQEKDANISVDGCICRLWPDKSLSYRIGAKWVKYYASGATLDGIEHKEMP